MRTGIGLIAARAAPLTLAYQASANSTASTITWPSIQANDIAFIADRANGTSLPAEVVPTGFTKITRACVTSGNHRLTVSYKILTGSESGSLTGQNGNQNNQKVMQIFRPSQAVSTINFGGLVAQQTDADPASRTVQASGSRTPSIVFGIVSTPSATTSFATASPSFDGTDATSNTRTVMGYKVYNTSPSDHTIDMADAGNDNIFSTFVAQFGASQIYVNSAYDAAVAAITNKTLYVRADPSFALGDTLTNINWDNEAVSTPNVDGTATMEFNIQNGYRGILANAGTEYGYPGSNLSTILGGSGLSYTMFAVEKRTGTQGGGTGDTRYQNSNVMADSVGFLAMTFDTSSRRFILQSYNGSYSTTDTGFDFSDGTAYVIAWRVASDGAVRVNFNGTTFTAGAGSQVNPSVFSGAFRLNKWTAGTNYGFEYIVSTDAASDGDMDALVTALKTKWGIT